MSQQTDDQSDSVDPERVAAGSQSKTLAAALIIGGAVAATAGAVLGTRALARRNAANGRVNATMAAAITASDVSNHQAHRAAREAPNAEEIVVASPTAPEPVA